MSILISVIIPSAGRRPDLLKKSIQSALINEQGIKTEIIVVLNGKDGMTFDLSNSFQHPLLTYHKIEEGNVCKARNFGLSVAQGQLIRFLDDDDYLHKDVAKKQYHDFLLNIDLDLSLFSLDIEDTKGNLIKRVNPSVGSYSFFEYALNPKIALPFAFVYRKKLIENVDWDIECRIPEDEDWLRRVATQGKINFMCSDQSVGVWYQHDGERLSQTLASQDFCYNKYVSIMNLYFSNPVEKYHSKMAEALWECVHDGFYFSPFFWSKIALKARSIDSKSKPKDLLFQKTPDFIHPLFIEWFMLPKRWLLHKFRLLKFFLGISSFIRKI
ncbi:glycosyltransferase family A protein [Acinetobacter sp. SA01]|uniref:glycosyltransferase family 2 protein n=1 Tax=Acinetobacter sp. SA01 TaxID=1862567 RepID=UPI00140744F9|nr:glycosyltransferase family A protein [Acinetobacter sp. SA01]